METKQTGTSKAWEPTGTPGLYRHNGRFYARISLNGKRTFRGLKTDTLTVARIRMAKLQAELEPARQSGATLRPDARTMGDLARIWKARVDASTRAQGTKDNYAHWLSRLERGWPRDFASTPASSVDGDTLVALRNNLKNEAKLRLYNAKKDKFGYSATAINQALLVLKQLTDLGRDMHVILSDPFEGTDVWMKKKTRKPVLPSRENMHRIFAEMLVVPNADRLDPAYVAYLEKSAIDAQEHAEWLAYTGARLEEANAACFEDFKADGRLWVHGTKSPDSDRIIPVVEALAGLLARIKARRTEHKGPILRVATSRNAIYRACERLGLARVRHHDLRHYFATVCIESGVDIPTVSRWLGHADGGALAMRTYGHLRDDHSVKQAAKVAF